jgi:ATP/maltotriose-dependent transcriptional regulator MalT
LFLDFLRTKQVLLTDAEKHRIYKASADWCRQNNFKTDALGYYEKVGDYESIVSILWELCESMSYDAFLYVSGIFDRAPASAFNSVDYLASMHLFTVLSLSRWQDFTELARSYERKLLPLPEDNEFRNRTLGGVYFFWSYMRFLMGAADSCYDFDIYMEKAAGCLIKLPDGFNLKLIAPIGPWGSAAGSSQSGAPQKFIEATSRLLKHTPSGINSTRGLDDLCRGELMFYQNSLRTAESFFLQALVCARKYGQFEMVQRSLFYIMRIAVMQGNRMKAEQTLQDMKALLNEKGYSRRFITYDIALGWYYCAIRQYDMVSDWLKGGFEPYGHAYFIENFGNQIRARYYYLNRNYLPLLTYIGELRQREAVLYGRVEILAAEACVHYQMNNKAKAFNTFEEAYETASPNEIITPFIELGKDMRTLAMAALRESEFGIPRTWLETIKSKSSSYSKYQSQLISEYRKANNMENFKDLTNREKDLLNDLYQGLSRSEIAATRNLSVSTVNATINSLYRKFNAHNVADIIRIASERKLLQSIYL